MLSFSFPKNSGKSDAFLKIVSFFLNEQALDLTLYITFTWIGRERATCISRAVLAERSGYRSLGYMHKWRK